MRYIDTQATYKNTSKMKAVNVLSQKTKNCREKTKKTSIVEFMKKSGNRNREERTNREIRNIFGEKTQYN